MMFFFFFSSRRRHTRFDCDWSSDVCSSDLGFRIRVRDDVVTATQVVLDTGTRTRVPEIEGLAGLPFIHAGNWLETTELPRRLVMLGGGSIGLEMAQFYRRMGAEVVLLESSAQVIVHEDEDVSIAV